jgi:predicted O-methyltransferase YrrM
MSASLPQLTDLARLAALPPQPERRALWGRSDDWTISDATAHFATLLVESFRCTSLLEFGAGRSSLVLASALDAIGGGRLTSIEHQTEFVADAWSTIGRFASVDARLVPAGLARRWSRQGLMHFYTGVEEALVARRPFDFVFIDGPPGYLGRDATLLEAAPHLAPGCLILLDDAARPAEQTAVRRWERAFDLARLYESTTLGKGVALLRMKGPQSPRFSPRTFLGSIHDRIVARQPGAGT